MISYEWLQNYCVNLVCKETYATQIKVANLESQLRHLLINRAVENSAGCETERILKDSETRKDTDEEIENYHRI